MKIASKLFLVLISFFSPLFFHSCLSFRVLVAIASYYYSFWMVPGAKVR